MVRYIDSVYVDVGEKIHIFNEVKPVNGDDVTFSIISAKWELYDSDEVLEAEGECIVNGNVLNALVQPEKVDWYKLKFIYEVADEIWIDVYRLKVN